MSTRPPNVVLFISDQQRADTIGAASASGVRTPHLDWVARDGVIFDRAYCPYPICTPSRMATLSGLYPHTNGMVANHQMRPGCDLMHYPEGVRNLGDYLGNLGYLRGYAGKWHLGSGASRPGFPDLWSGSSDYDVDSRTQNMVLRLTQQVGVAIGGKESGLEPDPTTYDEHTQVGPSLLPLAHHPSFFHMDHATGWVRSRKNDDTPFCLVYSCNEPHPPYTSPEPFHSMFDSDAMDLPPNWKDPAGPALVAHRKAEQLQVVTDWTEQQMRAMRAAYWGAVSYVDHLVGRLITALLDAEKWDNTLFIFFSDHGEMLGYHGLIAKGALMYEDLVRIPMIIHPPGGVGTPHRCAHVVSLIDLVPTIVRFCGGDPASILQGIDFGDLIRGADHAVNDGVAAEFHSVNWTDPLHPLRMWVGERWKYVESQDDSDELYDLHDDPLEMINLIESPAHALALEQARRGLGSWITSTGDSWPSVIQPPPRPPTLNAPTRS
jgi:arylsulfatase A-like enzyme